jgi:hypothetical protein
MNRIEALKLALRAIEYMIARYPSDIEHYYGEASPQYKAALALSANLAQAKNILKKELDAHTIYPAKTKP